MLSLIGLTWVAACWTLFWIATGVLRADKQEPEWETRCCGRVVPDLAWHVRVNHRVAVAHCKECQRNVDVDLWQAHLRLFHQPRFTALEDLLS